MYRVRSLVAVAVLPICRHLEMLSSVLVSVHVFRIEGNSHVGSASNGHCRKTSRSLPSVSICFEGSRVRQKLGKNSAKTRYCTGTVQISTADRTHGHARITGLDAQRAQAHNHTQNSNPRTQTNLTLTRKVAHTHLPIGERCQSLDDTIVLYKF